MTADTQELYQFAVHHGHLAAVSLFRPLPRMAPEDRKRREIVYNSKPGAKNPFRLEIICPWELDADDESVLMALLAIVGPADRRKTVRGGSKIRSILKEQGVRMDDDTLAVVATRREILMLLGWDTNGRNYERLEWALKRLENTNIHYTNTEGSQFSRLIAVHRKLLAPGERDGKITVLLNRLSAAVIAGNTNAGMAVQWIAERRSLDTQVSQILYSRCTLLLREGEERTFRVTMLAQRVFALADDQTASPKQWRSLVAALRSFAPTGWNVSLMGRGESAKATIFRPATSEIVPSSE
ncbi:MAG: replication protein C, IncQ-type [Luteolibacter sp.]